ncbi:hypothetical protein B0H16DRAFT_1893780 [Mycena metata]|uniref:F-box domain-containing protein n=1 Tax=Mycena metata TaxID=1033252 RepID=A0AAD7MRE3_9AGAR|nr:hypothetical protein B0H16DRAFT_1893780 [Mycena metata]
MHRSLRIPEVIGMICSQLKPVSWIRGGESDLAVLARTSTVFHDAALDVLWGRQETLMNLIRCMPADLWEGVSQSAEVLNYLRSFFGQPGVTQSRPIVASDWDRLLKYSPRVKFLRVDDEDPNVVPFFEALRLRFPDGYLLPNLQDLAWCYSSTASFGYARSVLPFIDLFLGPHIQTVGLARCERYAHYSILPDLLRKYPRLSTVSIGHRGEDDNDDEDSDDEEEGEDGNIKTKATDLGPPLVDQLSTFVRGLTHIRILAVGLLDRAALVHLGELDTLVALVAQLPASLSFPDIMHRSLFPRLRCIKLAIDNGDVRGLTQLLRTWNNASLGLFAVELMATNPRNFSAPRFPHGVEELHNLLGEHCNPDSLTNFSFDIQYHYDIDAGTFVYPGRFLRALFCFSKLTDVKIHVLDGFDIDDATLRDLACAWPYLQLLSLESQHTDRIATPRATLRGLQALAEHCSDLHTLALAFNATNVPLEVQITQEKLVSLRVDGSPITAPIPVAQFLAATFTNLNEIDSNYGRNHSEWVEVGKLLLETPEEEHGATQDHASTSVPVALNPME